MPQQRDHEHQAKVPLSQLFAIFTAAILSLLRRTQISTRILPLAEVLRLVETVPVKTRYQVATACSLRAPPSLRVQGVLARDQSSACNKFGLKDCALRAARKRHREAFVIIAVLPSPSSASSKRREVLSAPALLVVNPMMRSTLPLCCGTSRLDVPMAHAELLDGQSECQRELGPAVALHLSNLKVPSVEFGNSWQPTRTS
jgi:hypothetical protein